MKQIYAALSELEAVLLEWLGRRGDLLGLLWAWWEIASGRVPVDDPPSPITIQ